MWLLDRSVSLVALYEGYIDSFIEAVAELTGVAATKGSRRDHVH